MCFHVFVSAPAPSRPGPGIAWIWYDETMPSCVTPATVDQCTQSIRCDQFEVGFLSWATWQLAGSRLDGMKNKSRTIRIPVTKCTLGVCVSCMTKNESVATPTYWTRCGRVIEGVSLSPLCCSLYSRVKSSMPVVLASIHGHTPNYDLAHSEGGIPTPNQIQFPLFTMYRLQFLCPRLSICHCLCHSPLCFTDRQTDRQTDRRNTHTQHTHTRNTHTRNTHTHTPSVWCWLLKWASLSPLYGSIVRMQKCYLYGLCCINTSRR